MKNHKYSMLKWFFCLFVAVLFGTSCTNNYYANYDTNQFRTNLLELHNQQRKKHHVKPLVLEKSLCDYAQQHANKMASKNSMFHSSMSDLSKAIPNINNVGENVAWGQETELDVVMAWMLSPGHRWNILGTNYKKAGFGLSKDSKGRNYWCAVFSN